MVKATQLRPGMIIRHDGDLFTVFSVEHRTPGNKRGSMQTKMRMKFSISMLQRCWWVRLNDQRLYSSD